MIRENISTNVNQPWVECQDKTWSTEVPQLPQLNCLNSNGESHVRECASSNVYLSLYDKIGMLSTSSVILYNI